ncbi:MAG TPA: YciI family protein [Pseudonocardiaceae bacterium]|nr:YciI family protein [Pseudonocardiaceae bacterium]
MAQYLVLIYGNEQRWHNLSAAERRQIDAGHQALQTKAGTAVLATGELQQTGAATCLRAGPGGRPTVTDGPFLETKEVVGGFYVLEAADRDEAVSLVAGLAEAAHDHSGVEIRPLVDHG